VGRRDAAAEEPAVSVPPELVAQVRRDLAALLKHEEEVRAALVGLGEQPTDDAARGLVERHIEVRSLGELVSRDTAEADELLRLAVDDEEPRATVRGLVELSEIGTAFRALSRVLPRSFRAVSAEQEQAMRAAARAAADQRVWPDLPVRLRDVFVPPPATVSKGRAGGRTRMPQESGARADDVMDALRDALVRARVVVLTGVAGSGRTTVAAMLASALADDHELLPLWFDRAELVQLSKSGASTIFGLNERVLGRRGGVVAIADGIDDLPGRAVALDALLGAVRRDAFATLVLTVRRESVASLHPLVDPHRVIELEPFDRARVAAWSKRWQTAIQGTPDAAQGFDGTRYLGAPIDANDELGDALSNLVQLPFGLSLLANLHAHKRPLPEPSTARRRASLIREVLDGTCSEVAQRAGVSPAFARDALRRLAIVERASADAGARRERWREHMELGRFSEVLAEFGRSFLLRREAESGFVHGAFSNELAAEFVASRLARLLQRSEESSSGFAVDDREATALWASVVGICPIDDTLLKLLAEMFPDWSSFVNGRTRSHQSSRDLLRQRLPTIFLHLMRDDALDVTVSIARATGTAHALVVARSLAACFGLAGLTAPDCRGRFPAGDPLIAAHYAQASGRMRAELGTMYMDEIVQPRVSLRGCPADVLETIIEETDLFHLDLSSLDLSAASFDEGTIFGASLRDTDLRSSQWNYGTFTRIDFSNADLRGATFRGSRLWDCDVTNAVLIGVDLSRTEVERTDLSKAILTEDDARARGITLRP